MYVNKITINLDDAGSVLGAVADYAEMDADGRSHPLGRRAVETDDLQSLMPDVASLTAQVYAVTTERDEAVSVVTDKDKMIAARDAKIAELEAKIHPVDANGFAVLSPVQIRLGLLGAGITADQIDSIIDAIADQAQREAARYYWEYSREYHRDHALVKQFAGALGLASEQVDQMWSAAAKL